MHATTMDGNTAATGNGMSEQHCMYISDFRVHDKGQRQSEFVNSLVRSSSFKLKLKLKRCVNKRRTNAERTPNIVERTPNVELRRLLLLLLVVGRLLLLLLLLLLLVLGWGSCSSAGLSFGGVCCASSRLMFSWLRRVCSSGNVRDVCCMLVVSCLWFRLFRFGSVVWRSLS